MQFVAKVSKLNQSRIVVLPKMLADFCGFNLGSTVLIITNSDRSATILNNDEFNKRVARPSLDAAQGVPDNA